MIYIYIYIKEVNYVPYQPVYTIPASAPVQIPPLFRTGKNTGHTGEIQLFQPISGYRTSTFSHATLNF